MQLSPNVEKFSQLFSAFSESALNLEYFQKKDEPPTLIVSEVIECKRRGYLNA